METAETNVDASGSIAEATESWISGGGHSLSEVVPSRKLSTSDIRTMLFYNMRLIHRVPNDDLESQTSLL